METFKIPLVFTQTGYTEIEASSWNHAIQLYMYGGAKSQTSVYLCDDKCEKIDYANLNELGKMVFFNEDK